MGLKASDGAGNRVKLSSYLSLQGKPKASRGEKELKNLARSSNDGLGGEVVEKARRSMRGCLSKVKT